MKNEYSKKINAADIKGYIDHSHRCCFGFPHTIALC